MKNNVAFLFGFAFLGLLFCPVGQARASGDPSSAPVGIPQAIPQDDGAVGGVVPYVKDPDKPKEENEHYEFPTFENLSRLYWTLGILDPEKNAQAIDNFVRIHDCQVYLDYYRDDFEWRKIRAITKEKIVKERGDWPVRFELLIPVELGRYDFAKKEFPVLSEFLKEGARRITTGYNSMQDPVCDTRAMKIPDYPRDIVLNLSRPILIESIPMDPDLAQDYLIRTKILNAEAYRDRDDAVRERRYERMAFLRLRVRLIKFMEFMKAGDRGEMYPLIFSSVESFDVFEDQDMKKVLYKSLQ